MKNKDIHEWLLDNCIDSLLTIKDTKGAEIYLTDLLTKHLTEQQHVVVRGGDKEARDCGCTYSIHCDERKDCVKKQIDADFARNK